MSLIFGLVKDSAGNPIRQARVSFVSGPVPLPDIAALTGDDGTFALSVPRAGEYVIEIILEGFITNKVKVLVEGNKEEHIEIRLLRHGEN